MPNQDAPSKSAIDFDRKLSLDDRFVFSCGPHVPCFTECCQKLDLLLTPYDVLRLRKRLGLSAAEFLEEHTDLRMTASHGFPEVMLRMNEANDKRCPFVTAEGCSIYEDRPAACRIYPLGRAATSHPLDGSRREFYFTVRESHCRGFEQTTKWSIREWIGDQGLEEYHRLNDLLMELYVLKTCQRGLSFTPPHIQMFMMACYNLERFRDFVFGSGFLRKFRIEDELVESLRTDDVKLLEFAFTWLRFALFREPVLELKAG